MGTKVKNRDMSVSRVAMKWINITRRKPQIAEFTKKRWVRNYGRSITYIEMNWIGLSLSSNQVWKS
jgi:hypothetical protein